MKGTEAHEPLTAVVGAMPEEVAPLWARLALGPNDTRAVGGVGRVVRGRLGQHAAVVAASREGDRNARAATAELLHAFPVTRLLAIGVAGALSPGLSPLALVVADDVRQVGGGLHRPPPGLAEWAARVCGARRAHVVTAPTLADSPSAKAELDERFGDGTAAVVDLESAACAGEAERAGIPWLVVRAVADAADEGLPPLLNRCRDARGAIQRHRVVSALLRDPLRLPLTLGRLLELRRRVTASAQVLAGAVQSLLDAWPDGANGTIRLRTRNMEELR